MRATIHIPVLTLRDAKPRDMFTLNTEGLSHYVFALLNAAHDPRGRCVVVIASTGDGGKGALLVGSILFPLESTPITLLEQVERAAFRRRCMPGETNLSPLEREELQKQLARLRADIESAEPQPPGAPQCAIRGVAVDEVPTTTDPPSRL